MAAVGDGYKGDNKDGINGVVVGDALQVSNLYGADIWEKEMDGDGGHVKINRGIKSSGR